MKKVLAIALGLPSTILGSTYVLYLLVEKKIINEALALTILLAIIAQMFYLMIRYDNSKKD